MKRVEAARCSALELTADAPILGRRERDIRNSLSLPEDLWAANLTADASPDAGGGLPMADAFAALMDPGLRWDDVGWLTSITDLPVLVKGIVRVEDAIRAVDAGASGVVVSNHGGRQFDTAPAAIDALKAITDAVGDRTEVLVDGEQGIDDVLTLLRDELDVAMALCGCRSVDEITVDLLEP